MPLYAFIYISFLFYHLLLALTYIIIAYYIIACLSYAKSKLYIFTYRIRARGFWYLGLFWAFWGVLGRFWRSCPLIGRFVDGRRAFGAFCGRVRACFPVRAGVRGCTPAIFRARPTPARLPSHSVRRVI